MENYKKLCIWQTCFSCFCRYRAFQSIGIKFVLNSRCFFDPRCDFYCLRERPTLRTSLWWLPSSKAAFSWCASPERTLRGSTMCTVSSAQMLQSALAECITAAEWKALITKARLAAAVRELFFKSVISNNFCLCFEDYI